MEDEEELGLAMNTWNSLAKVQTSLTDSCSLGDVEREAEWIEQSLTEVLKKHAKEVKLCARSKRWWGPLMVEAWREYSRACKALHAREISEEEHQKAC